MAQLKNILPISILTAFCFVSQAATIAVLPASQSVNVGSTVTVSLTASGLSTSAAPSIGTYDINLDFTPSLISFVSAAFGTGLDVLGLGSIQTVTPGTGTINLFELSLDSAADLNALQSDTITLATLTFNAVAMGTSPLALAINALGDANGAALSVTSSNASVAVSSPTAVPEPSELILFIVGSTAFLFWTVRVLRRQV